MRRFFVTFLSILVMSSLTTSVFGESVENIESNFYKEDANVFAEYYALDGWNGHGLYYDNNSGAVFFILRKDAREGDSLEFPSTDAVQSTEYAFDLPSTLPSGFCFSIDIGNGSEKVDSGTAELIFYDEKGEPVLSTSSGTISGSKNYKRYSIASETGYFPVPNTAKTVKLKLSATSVDDDYMIDVYFRNISLIFSNTKDVMTTAATALNMDISDDLSIVEIGTNEFMHWVWVGIIFCVAIIFFVIRTARDRISKR